MSLPLYLLSALLFSFFVMLIESNIFADAEAFTPYFYLRSSIVTLAICSIFLALQDMFGSRSSSGQNRDLEYAVGRYEQRIEGLAERPAAILTVYFDDTDEIYRIEGYAFDNFGSTIAYWKGIVVDLIPDDGKIEWIAIGHIFEGNHETRIVRNYGMMHLLPHADNDNSFPGYFEDTFGSEVETFKFRATKLVA